MKLLLLFFSLFSLAFADLQVGFYNSTCPQAESIILQVVQNHFNVDRSVTAAFLRMHFHDCFVRGCDASILIDSKGKNKSEKAAVPNLTVRGFEIIDEIKTKLESQCPSIVSCADVIAVATRDAVVLAGGPNYAIPTGRRDGLVSNVNDVDLPGPTFSISDASQAFSAKGLSLDEMVTLLGAHTVGVAHCGFFRDRLFDFQGTGAPDPSMDSTLLAKLKSTCGTRTRPLSKDPTAFLDQNTSFIVDNQYYNQVIMHKGIMQIDQELSLDNSTSGLVATFGSDGVGFLQKFSDAMVKMGSIEVLVGSAGEIRKNCRVFNKPAKSKSVKSRKGKQLVL